jgi:hypothetical protein
MVRNDQLISDFPLAPSDNTQGSIVRLNKLISRRVTPTMVTMKRELYLPSSVANWNSLD